MKIESFDDLKDGERFDFIVIGSGFGGSVAALRLTEKGYTVAVLEAGRHFEDDEFPKTNWNLRRYLWLPKFGCWGIQRLTWLKELFVLSGAGLGGGSLVYANTLLEPTAAFYNACRAIDPGFEEKLKPHLARAKKMLGVTRTPRVFAADEILETAARDLGRGETFKRAEVGVYFGAAGETAQDPYFDGRGPARSGCVFCGGCMVGCRHNAKNTLVKNYLYLAAKLGARMITKTTAVRLSERRGGGLRVTTRRSGWGFRTKVLSAGGVVMAAGVLGTIRLLLEPSNRIGPLLPRLGRDVRTNGEALLGALAPRGGEDWSQGLAIASGAWPDDETHVEVVRYSAGSDAMALLGWPRGGGIVERLSALWPFGWAKRAAVLLAMQTRDSRISLGLGTGGRLNSRREPDAPPLSVRLPAAERLQEAFCRRAGDAVPMTTVFEAGLGVAATAHILGGACRAASPEEGCVDGAGKLFGRDDLWVVDGSAVPANPGVNPSLTITALAEQAMSLVPAKSGESSP